MRELGPHETVCPDCDGCGLADLRTAEGHDVATAMDLAMIRVQCPTCLGFGTVPTSTGKR